MRLFCKSQSGCCLTRNANAFSKAMVFVFGMVAMLLIPINLVIVHGAVFQYKGEHTTKERSKAWAWQSVLTSTNNITCSSNIFIRRYECRSIIYLDERGVFSAGRRSVCFVECWAALHFCVCADDTSGDIQFWSIRLLGSSFFALLV